VRKQLLQRRYARLSRDTRCVSHVSCTVTAVWLLTRHLFSQPGAGRLRRISSYETRTSERALCKVHMHELRLPLAFCSRESNHSPQHGVIVIGKWHGQNLWWMRLADESVEFDKKNKRLSCHWRIMQHYVNQLKS